MNKNSNISLFCSKPFASRQGLFIARPKYLGLGFSKPRLSAALDEFGA